jgi:crotonobetainyl-CoA:carnitine CoA-transferase CaiB-like acyl-CoA transferase
MAHLQPLDGYTVIEIGHSVAAPYTGFILASLGAQVIKVENPDGGDPARDWGPPYHEGVGPHFAAFNRNKKSIAVDLSNEAERAALQKLILEKADAVICNLRAGSAEKNGVGPRLLRQKKSALVYCEIGAFGSTGPMSGMPGYDPLMQAYGGLMSITGENAERPPVRVGVSIIDMGAGLWAAVGILGALLERQKTGEGCLVETSLFETALAWTATPIARFNMNGLPQAPQGSGAAGIVPYQAFRTSDGWVMIAVGSDKLFVKLAAALGNESLAQDPRFKTNGVRVKNQKELLPLIEQFSSSKSSQELIQLLNEFGVPNTPVQTIGQVIQDPQALALEIIQSGPEGACPTVGVPLQFNGKRPPYKSASPKLGEHTEQLLLF